MSNLIYFLKFNLYTVDIQHFFYNDSQIQNTRHKKIDFFSIPLKCIFCKSNLQETILIISVLNDEFQFYHYFIKGRLNVVSRVPLFQKENIFIRKVKF